MLYNNKTSEQWALDQLQLKIGKKCLSLINYQYQKKYNYNLPNNSKMDYY